MGTAELAEHAMLLAPLKLAIELREYARALDLPTPHSQLTARNIESTLSMLSAA